MKKFAKMALATLALVVALSTGASTEVEAAKAKKYVKKVVSVDKLSGKKTITLTKGKKATLKSTVTVTKKKYNKAKYKKLTFKSSNKKVATVNKKGVITAKKTGSCKITVTSVKNKKKATVKVKVVAGKVTSVKMNKKTASMTEGDKLTLKATVKSKGKKANKKVVWKTSNKKVATVKNGVVTAVGAGTVKITATATDGTNKKATCTITVAAKPAPVQPAPTKTTYTTITPVQGAKADVTVSFSGDKAKIAADVTKLVKAAGIKEGESKVVTVNGKDATVVYEGGVLYVKGNVAKMTLADYITDKTAKDDKVVVTYGANAAKAVAALQLAPLAAAGTTYTYDITIDGVKVTSMEISATGIKLTVDGTAYDMTVNAGVIEVKGDVTATAAVKKLVEKKLATVATVQK